MQQILCVAFSQCREWDSQNVVLTGSTDGVVRVSIPSFLPQPQLGFNVNFSKSPQHYQYFHNPLPKFLFQMWSIDYVQVPKEEQESFENSKKAELPKNKKAQLKMQSKPSEEEPPKSRVHKKLQKQQMHISSMSTDFTVEDSKCKLY